MTKKSFAKKLAALAAMALLCFAPLHNVRAQDPCANFSMGQVDPSTWAGWVLAALNDCTPTNGSCNASQCTDCRYVGFSTTGPCSISSLQFNATGACFSMCAVFGNPITWEYWTSSNSKECAALNKTLTPNDGNPLHSTGALQMKVCGTFPMTLCVKVHDCVTNTDCTECITVN